MNDPAMTDKILSSVGDYLAPDGSTVRLLAQGRSGGMAHFELGEGAISAAQQHRTVEEVWYILEGLGQMWRKQEGVDGKIIDLRSGVSMTIPPRTSFQFRNTGRAPLAAIGVTMPPWPGPDEAVAVEGIWRSA
jgi:mannose-6-phosphate isomerase-like protein (cupin superfamily)